MSNVVIFAGSDYWSAVYLDGKLARVGEHYLIDETEILQARARAILAGIDGETNV